VQISENRSDAASGRVLPEILKHAFAHAQTRPEHVFEMDQNIIATLTDF
jgi:hypothetical protein